MAAIGHRQLSEEQNAAQYVIKRKKLIEVLDQYFPDPRGRTLLDAGCGAGVLSEAFAHHGYDVTGVDFCESAVRAARRRVPSATFFTSPVDELCLGRQFDVITVVDVLLHVVDDEAWRRTLAVLANHLRTDGLLLIIDSMIVKGQSDAAHCRRRSASLWGRSFEQLGLRVIQQECFKLPHECGMKDLFLCACGSTPVP